MIPRTTALLCLVVLLVPVALEAQEEDPPDESMGDFWTAQMEQISWVHGPGRGVMGKLAEIDVPEGMVFTSGAGTRKILDLTGNISGPGDQGTLAPAAFLDPEDEEAWWLVFEFEDIGYVKNADEEEIDADEMLEQLKEETKQGNEARRQRGLATLTLEGWARPPYYDPETKDLQWGTRLSDDQGGITINHHIRLLGRRGVMRATLVVDPDLYDAALAEAKGALTGYRFQSGETYGEYRAGDKVWEYGLTGLIVGTGAAIALKSGLLKHLWKIIVAVGVGIAALFKKIFGGGSKKNVYRRPDRGEAPPAA
jgi:uncharacterized membrane-anchored protein